jgi:arylsulfatase A-like enzyme
LTREEIETVEGTERNRVIPKSTALVSQILRDNSYATGMFGKQGGGKGTTKNTKGTKIRGEKTGGRKTGGQGTTKNTKGTKIRGE